ncbi:MAG: hypothetical protein IPO76_01205 [Elusimicrobia bacterium]|jgi:hypothetical protein|nr:hypothetical protein [Elusimicrobiota bacterium]MBK7208343.1 hypothetical protein [Elusimicrobiota bacterium]MBK7545103.1 hypothetical protein [Elusimicrobiota bacterium]MBK7574622.1 hypothetical protein [Elusimicrobiota bacterium]MBK7688009.1 hypothetical protein [Elusimicrobiota bacterium]
MRKLLAVFAALGMAGSAFSGDLLGLKNLSVDGSIEYLGKQANNQTDADDGNEDSTGDTASRVRLGLNAQVTEGVSSRIEVVRYPDWAGNPAMFGDDTESVNDELDNFEVLNAYLELDNILGLDKAKIGRQYVGRPGDLIAYFGPFNDDYLYVTSLSSLVLSKKVGPVNVNAVLAKANDDDFVAFDTDDGDGSGDENINWITASSDELIKVEGATFPLEIGLYQWLDQNTDNADDNQTLNIYDLRAGANLLDNALKLSLEYAMNAGQDNNGGTAVDYKGNALVFKAAYDNEDNGWGVKALYANASGDDNGADTKDEAFHSISSDFRYGQILSNDTNFWSSYAGSNLTGYSLSGGLDTDSQGPGLNIIGLGGNYNLPILDKKYTVYADYFMAKLNETGSFPDDIGNEIDLTVKYVHNDNVSVKAGYAMLMPGDGLNGTGAPDDDITKLWAKLMVKWGK